MRFVADCKLNITYNLKVTDSTVSASNCEPDCITPPVDTTFPEALNASFPVGRMAKEEWPSVRDGPSSHQDALAYFPKSSHLAERHKTPVR